ncbi:MAG: transglutaminase domain-containing protein, partial [Lachnoclostridium sp.]|nr:transglutaminase domain-containing protein [Lachnoclostridium sp.]
MKNHKFFNFISKTAQILLLFFGVYSSLMCITIRLNTFLYQDIVFIFLLIFSFAIWWLYHLLNEIPRGAWIALCIGIILPVVFVLRFGSVLLKGMVYVVNSIFKLSMIYYNIRIDLLNYPSDTEQYSTAYSSTLFIIAVGFIILLLISMTFYRKRRAAIYILLTFPLFIFPYFVGYVSFYTETIIYLLTMAAILTTSQNKRHPINNRLRDKLALYSAGIVLLCSLFGYLLYPPDKYEQNKEAHKSVKKEFTDVSVMTGDDLFEWLKANLSAPAIEYGSVGQRDQVVYNGVKLLEIQPTLVTNSSLYLKGFVGDKYRDGHWFSNQADKTYQDDLLRLESELGGGPDSWQEKLKVAEIDSYWRRNMNVYEHLWFTEGSITIKNIALGRNNTVIPYFLMGDVKYDSEGNVKYDSETKYTLDYYCKLINVYYEYYRNAQSLPALDEGGKNADSNLINSYKLLSDFANKYYLDLPENAKEQIFADFQAWCNAKKITANSPVKDRVNTVLEYLTFSGDYIYSLSPGKTPEEKDSIDYFLNENRKGYCVHFASSAVLMLRYLGVPARFVEGVFVDNKRLVDYAKNKEPFVAVLDKDAHAWVEVFIDGIGFVPFDFTPGRSNSDELLGRQQQPSPSPSQAPSPPPTSTPDGANSLASSESPPPADYEEMEFEDIEQNTDNSDTSSQSKSLAGKVFTSKLFWLLLLFVIIIIPACIHGQWMLRQRFYGKSLQQKSMRARAGAMYFHIKPLLTGYHCAYNGESLDGYTDILCQKLVLPEDQIKPFVQNLMKSQFAKDISKEEYIEYKRAYRNIRRKM